MDASQAKDLEAAIDCEQRDSLSTFTGTERSIRNSPYWFYDAFTSSRLASVLILLKIGRQFRLIWMLSGLVLTLTLADRSRMDSEFRAAASHYPVIHPLHRDIEES
ncbi:hypothetical protein SISNIDRAFT_469469 [Sistotremastrum niveocremeum HHB9708]|uniref:Uncharacterized protein n=1 Tax=Sistotremastrum niveocremeum HHB9708 TaxID=1314777 RepID=A0A164PZI2_9AGAM|nr:hypothetical protein SISNIDRAFT_469469 [Sistotremastrum niveocremeum HHB9708]